MERNLVTVLDGDLAQRLKGLTTKQFDAEINAYIANLTPLVDQNKSDLRKNALGLLQSIDPAVHSIGCLVVLQACLEHPDFLSRDDAPEILDKTVAFVASFDTRQIRYVGSLYLKLLEQVCKPGLYSATVLVSILSTAILRLDPSGSTFTSTHLTLAKVAYDSDKLDPALDVIGRSILFVPHTSSPLESPLPLCSPDLDPSAMIAQAGLSEPLKAAHILEYNYVCGLIYTSQREWVKARLAFERVIVHPVTDKGVSKIMVEAHHKWLLTALMGTGRAPHLPTAVVGAVRHVFQVMSKPYTELAEIFESNNVSRLKGLVEEHALRWETDRNRSLVTRVCEAYQPWQIIRLRSVFSHVSIAFLRESTLDGITGEASPNDEAVLGLVRDMIAQGILQGEVIMGQQGDDTYLKFLDIKSNSDEQAFTLEILRSQQRIRTLGERYKLMEARLSANPHYVRHVVREQKRSEKDEPEAVELEGYPDDEDLMTDVMSQQ